MKIIAKVSLVAGMAAFLSGCWTTPSLHPLYTEDSKVFEPALLGIWKAETDSTETSFTLECWNGDAPAHLGVGSYKVTYSDEDGSSWYRGVLTEIDDRLYLDIQVEGDEWDKVFDDIELASPLLLLPTHGIYRITLDGDALLVEKFLDNPEPWDPGPGVWERIVNDELHLRHEIIDANDDDKWRLVTASTAELRDFISSHGSERGVFYEIAAFSRQSTDAPETEDQKY